MIPEYLEPFGPIMGALIICWLLAISLSLHRATGYFRRRHALKKRWGDVGQKIRDLKNGRQREDSPFVKELCEAIRRDPSLAGLKRFFDRIIRPQRQADFWNERGLSVLGSLAPLLGLAGTCWGILLTFDSFAGQADSVTLKELAGPFSIALRTTLFGVGCAAFCLPIRRLIPMFELHRQEDDELESSWMVLRKLIRAKEQRAQKAEHSSTETVDKSKAKVNGKPRQQGTKSEDDGRDRVFASVDKKQQAAAMKPSKQASRNGDESDEFQFI